MEDSRSLPIGLFDSGMGGLTVLRALTERLPNENYRFLGDTARLPYGTKGRETIIHYTLNSARKLIEYGNVKMLVIACNTATGMALPSLRSAFPDIPVLGVIKPGAKAAVNASKSGYIVVTGTEATVRGGAYQRAICQLNPKAHVVSRACTLFVPLAEEGWMDGDVVEGTARRYLGDLFEGEKHPDTLLLGCTHFPILRDALSKVVGSDVSIVDSAQTTAEAVAERLEKLALLSPSQETGWVHFMATDNRSRFARTGSLFLGRNIEEEDVELVDI